MQEIFKGKPVVEQLSEQLKAKVEQLGHEVTLAIVLVGEDPASHYYKDHLVKLAQSIDVKTKVCSLKGDADTKEVLGLLKELNADSEIDGILPMMPMPKQIDTTIIEEAISPAKDIDCLHPANAGMLYLGRSAWAPCTAMAVMQILKYYKVELKGKRVVIIGRSNVVGKPLIPLLLSENATVTVCHSKTVAIPAIAKQADVIIAAVGVKEFVTPEMVKDGAVLIDVGINETENGMVGDIAKAAYEKASAYTPVPGGVGTVSSMMVMKTLLLKK